MIYSLLTQFILFWTLLNHLRYYLSLRLINTLFRNTGLALWTYTEFQKGTSINMLFSSPSSTERQPLVLSFSKSMSYTFFYTALVSEIWVSGVKYTISPKIVYLQRKFPVCLEERFCFTEQMKTQVVTRFFLDYVYMHASCLGSHSFQELKVSLLLLLVFLVSYSFLKTVQIYYFVCDNMSVGCIEIQFWEV